MKGELRWTIDSSTLTKSAEEIPDTNDFILSICDSKGNRLYEGKYGDSPEYLSLDAGNYTIRLISLDFNAPAFSRPQYGDEQLVIVPPGESVCAKLQCTLLNAGIKLNIGSDFPTAFPDGILYVKQESTRLKWLYKEKRIAYVMPGAVSIILYNEGKDVQLLTRTLKQREILSLNVSVANRGANSGSSLSVSVDTSRNWTNDSYIIGGDNSGGNGGGNEDKNAVSVANSANYIGKTVWVCGYIVGGDLSSSGASVKTSGINKDTHLAIADRSSVTAKSSCLAVELPKGAIRDALNLVDHPELIGRRVYVKGKIVDAYFNTRGMKGTNDYDF